MTFGSVPKMVFLQTCWRGTCTGGHESGMGTWVQPVHEGGVVMIKEDCCRQNDSCFSCCSGDSS